MDIASVTDASPDGEAARVPAFGGLAARAFATDPADLAVRIDAREPVRAVDALLCACLEGAGGERPTTAQVRGWTAADRLDALLAIRLAAGAPAESLPLRCGDASCGERFEAEIDLGRCRQPASPPATIAFEAGGRRLRARPPTGADQARWQRERTPLALVAASLLAPAQATRPDGEPSGAEVDDVVIDALDAALAAHDPSRELSLRIACPVCARLGLHRVDLEAHLLTAFAAEQLGWLREIGRLAQAFHWSEAELAAMPRWRRRFYLARLDAGEAAVAPP